MQHCQGSLSVDRLQELQSIHQGLLIKAWSPNYVKPKQHQRFHQVMQMKRINFHCDAFASEEKHSTHKSPLDCIGLIHGDKRRKDFSQLVLRAIWQHHMPSLTSYKFETKLVGQSSPFQIVSNILGARQADEDLHVSYSLCSWKSVLTFGRDGNSMAAKPCCQFRRSEPNQHGG